MVHGEPATRQPISPDVIRDLLRSSVDEEDATVSAGKTGVFLYAAAAADAAETAERMAGAVLARQGLDADIRLERWDPSREVWLDVRTGLPADAAAADVLPGRGRSAGRRRLRSVGALVAAIIDGIGGDWLYPGSRVVACGSAGSSSVPGPGRPLLPVGGRGLGQAELRELADAERGQVLIRSTSVTAPDSTTDAHGWASAAAMATASGVVSASAARRGLAASHGLPAASPAAARAARWRRPP